MFEKKREPKVVVGYDLGNVTSQISYSYLGEEEPETLSTIAGLEQFNFPTILCKRREVNQWFYGKEAIKSAGEGEGTVLTNLLTLAKQGESITVENMDFAAEDLLVLFVKRSLALLSMVCSQEQVASFVITVDELNPRMLELLQKVAEELPFDASVVSFQAREESFFSYMIQQPEELWLHQVMVLDASEDVLKVFRLEMNRRCTPVVAFIEKNEYPEIDFGKQPKTKMALENFRSSMDGQILEIAKGCFRDRMITSVYLIGDAFAGEWCMETLRFLCRGRRVFQGNNMYSKGACYWAKEKEQQTELGKGHVFLGNDKVKANIGMKVIRDGVERYFAILDAGQNWYECKKEFDLILERGRELSFLITPLNGKEPRIAEITLDGLPDRPAKATRIRVDIICVSESQIRIHIEDMGFGEMYEASGLDWTEEFEIL